MGEKTAGGVGDRTGGEGDRRRDGSESDAASGCPGAV